MFKKISTIILVFVVILLVPVINASALEQKNVKDYMNYLKDSEIIDLQNNIESVIKDHNLDVVVVITKDTQGKDSMTFADDYYDNNGYGVGGDYSGILLLINMDKRETWISTTGRAIDIFTDKRIDDITNLVTSQLSKGNYNNACINFVNAVKNYAAQGVPQGQHREEVNPGTSQGQPNLKTSYLKRVLYMIKFFPVYLGALVIAIVATIIASLSSKGKVTINSRTYEDGSFALNETRDDFIRESVTKTKIQTSSNNQSSTHSGSSGRSHGGGGGKF
ncbi:TPM domain-containing protein [Clostridium sp.]|uniref:TPM domain-containing protein n=1 Tax=Clostridium sp. TaxID=1506 RepID=UPI002FCA3AAD